MNLQYGDKKNEITFLFFHYGKIPKYLDHAIEHVRIFNPEVEIHLVADVSKDLQNLDRFEVSISRVEDHQSEKLKLFKKSYRHISYFNEKYERFVLERWFILESFRAQRPERIYVTLDSDVALFANVKEMTKELSECPILLTTGNPGFNFIKGDISDFLNFINEYYNDPRKIGSALAKFKNQNDSNCIYTFGEMQLLFEYLALEKSMRIHPVDTKHGFIDGNIHLPQGFDFLKLRRRPRKKIFWRLEEGKAIPYFKKGEDFVKVFLLHFQGPGKRVFHRFNSIDGPTTPFQIWWWNQIFQKRWLANLT